MPDCLRDSEEEGEEREGYQHPGYPVRARVGSLNQIVYNSNK